MDGDLTRAVACVLVVLGLVACSGSGGVHNKGAIGDLPPPRTPESTLFPPPSAPARAVKVWEARGLRQALNALQRAVGGYMLMTDLVLYPDYAIVEALDPTRRENVDRYLFRAGKVDPPSEVPTTLNEDLEAKLFTRAQVSLSQVPRLVRDAPVQLGITGARTTHVIVQRDTVFAAGRVVIRVYAGTARRSGYVEYDASGVLRKVQA
jgi:hypothetical protein